MTDVDFPSSSPPLAKWAFLGRHRKTIAAVASLTLFCLMAAAIYRLTEEVSYDDVVRGLSETSPRAVLLALFFTSLSFATLILYDWNALASIRKRLPLAEVALTAFSAYAVGNTAGFGALSGGAVRYRAYSRLGLSPEEIGRIVAFVTLSFTLGLTVITALSLLAMAPQIGRMVGISPDLLRVGSIAVLLLFAAIFVAAQRYPQLSIGPFTLRLADSKTLSRQFLVTVVDLAASASVVYVLLPDSTISWPTFFAIYSVAIGIGIASHVPAGIGVFETIIIASLGGRADVDAVLASLIVYRLIYYVLPLLLAIVLVTITEVRQLAGSPASANMAKVATRLAAPLIATLSLILGTMLVFSSVTPTPTDNLALLENFVPLPVIESAHFLASLLGLTLVVAARGLSQRLDGAWWTAVLVAFFALVLSLLKAFALIEAALLAFLLAGLFASRPLFNRPASLFRQALTTSWLLAIAVICIGAAVIMLFVYRDVDYSHDLWWQFEFSAEAPRALRAMLGITVVSSAVAVFSLLRPAAPAVLPSDAGVIDQAVAILANQGIADANLVRVGDKSVMFSPAGDAFIMYARQGRSWIAFLDPIGAKEAQAELVWQFVETARTAGCRAVFYQVSPALLPALADAGLQSFKLGELASVDLAGFDLKGGRWATLRQTTSRAERDGLTFDIIAPADIPSVLPDLKAVSDDWLKQHSAREKGFSLGAFTTDYIVTQPVAVLRLEGAIVAFANVLLTATAEEASIDLMRFSSVAPKGSMDFLFVSLMSHLRADGVRHFNLGMAPLSGLSRRDIAPVWDRIANTVYEHGEHFYNFKGLRAFKSKFHPQWQPRYLAASGGLNPVIALLDSTLLIGGGLKGVVKK
ncbi:MAG: bifunctional lysylphosphatidylglycerol flippase/synthetase MprF [Allorhizobium sp.]